MKVTDLEQTTAIRMLIFLNGSSRPIGRAELVRAMKASQAATYNALKKLHTLGLITQIDAESFPYRKDVTLNEKGRRVAEHLLEVEKILTEK